MKKQTPPFAWLGRFWLPVALSLIILTALFFRFYHLSDLPPGLDEASAASGLEALALPVRHFLPALNAASGYAPLWVWLQGLSLMVFGHTILALRILPALLGTLGVVAVWLWLRDWFNRPTAWIGAIIMAVSPWAVTVSRSGLEGSLVALLVPLTLWLALRAQRRMSTGRVAALAGVLVADLLSGPIGVLLAGAVIIVGMVQLFTTRPRIHFSRSLYTGAAMLLAGLAATGYSVVTSWHNIATMAQTLGIAHSWSALGHNLLRVLLMFNVSGDENYRHNLSGEPMLNAFVGLMMVTGLLIAISRSFARRYRALLFMTFLMLIPAVLASAGVPNSAWAAGAMPLIFGLAAIGTYYMLELWYATFPINSAARATGQAAIVLLLALTLLQGYTQYFGAWADSTAVHLAYNEGTVQIAQQLRTEKFNGQRYAVIAAGQMPVLSYLNYDLKSYQAVQPADLTALPLSSTGRQFYIGADQRDATVKILKAKFPGGVLRPHYSSFNQIEIYYTYETAK